MLGNIERDKKLKEMIELTNISDEEFEKLDYKEKQKYFRAKNKLCKVFYSGNKTYKKKTKEGK